MKARIIIPVWGEKYLKRFNAFCLPALLASGNLPHLSENFDCELVIVTQSSNFESVRSLSSVIQAQQFAQLRLVSIDDKLSHPAYYGLTITHALYRGFTDLGEDAKEIWCLFLNADFILADGSYRSLVKKMLAGERCIFSPSYCVIEEEVRSILANQYFQDGVLAVPKREMASLILDHKHFTIRAKIINQKMYSIDHVDQFYYQFDNNTLLGKQLPIALVAFRPELVPVEPVTFWDYGVVSEICPTAPLCVLGDSDDFLMLEFRGKESMQGMLKIGWMDPQKIANDLSKWSTKDQRESGKFNLIVHRENIPSNIEHAKDRLNNYFLDVLKRMTLTPRDYRNHFIWTGVNKLHDQWVLSQKKIKQDIAVNEDTEAKFAKKNLAKENLIYSQFMELVMAILQVFAGGSRGVVRQKLYDLMRVANAEILGRPPEISSYHPRYVDTKPVLDRIMHLPERNALKAISIWGSNSAMIAPFLSNWIGEVLPVTLGTIMAKGPDLSQIEIDAPFDLCFLELNMQEFSQFKEVHRVLRPFMKKGSKYFVFCQISGEERLRERDFNLIANAMPVTDVAILEMRSSWAAFQAQRLWESIIQTLNNGTIVDFLMLPIYGLSALALIIYSLIVKTRNQVGSYNKNCTSLFLRVKVD